MIRLIIPAFLVLIVAALVVINFSGVKTVLVCEGEITRAEQSRPGKLHASLNLYRWWVGLWSDSDGDFMIELDGGELRYFDLLNNGPTIVEIRIGQLGKSEYGSYSKLSKTLRLNTGFGFFDGKCTADK